ncbi:MAG TPA: ATP-dependent DNA ligase, partial [Actinomycetota bacterium]|nr:ATP-dependent DNA ligase [Actinomycetota bacterium]
MLLQEIAETSAAVAGTRSRLAKTEQLAECLRRLRPEEVPIAVAYLAGELPQGSIGVGWASLRELPPPASTPTLELLEVDAALRRVQATTGSGSQAARRRELHGLFGRATEDERKFLTGLLLGELRQGALEGVMVEAVARAAGIPPPDIRRAAMLAGDLGPVAEAAIAKGARGLAHFRLTVLQPVQPMLAHSAESLEDAFARTGTAAVEWKFDGARVQVHRLGREVRAFTRNLADMTDRVPEVVEAVAALPVDSIVLDGEAIALYGDGRPHPFQDTMSRFGTQVLEEQLMKARLSAFFFDCLHLNGDDLIDRATTDRFEALRTAVPNVMVIPRIVAGEPSQAKAFFEEALARGHEGVMVKALDTPYEAGRRGASWQKVKRAKTLDLVILAAEWGHGRRQKWLSNLHLGARDRKSGQFVMLGK